MIQSPKAGEIVIGVPGAGALITQHGILQRCFGGMLAPGLEEQRGSARCIDWDVTGRQPLSPGDPRFDAAVRALAVYAERSRHAADLMRRALEANPGAARLTISAEILDLIGRPGTDAPMERRDVERLVDTHRLAARAVEYALRSPVLYADERSVALCNWGYLPGEDVVRRQVEQLSVRLANDGIVEISGADRRVLSWAITGQPEQVQLFATAPTPGAARVMLERNVVEPGQRTGSWRLPTSLVPPGTVVQAEAIGPDGTVQSVPLVIGGELRDGRVIVDGPSATGRNGITEPTDMGFAGAQPRKDPRDPPVAPTAGASSGVVAGSDRPGCGARLWQWLKRILWWLLWILLAILLAILLWFLLRWLLGLFRPAAVPAVPTPPAATAPLDPAPVAQPVDAPPAPPVEVTPEPAGTPPPAPGREWPVYKQKGPGT